MSEAMLEYTTQDVDMMLKIANAAIKRNGIMKDALQEIASLCEPFLPEKGGHSYMERRLHAIAKQALTKVEANYPQPPTL